jgi:hypothetical protein
MIRFWKILVIAGMTLEFCTQSHASLGPRAEYIVPGSPELESVSKFELEGLRWSHVGDAVSLAYPLPQELVGAAGAEIRFQGQVQEGPFLELLGDHGEAVCIESESGVNCLVQFKKLGVEPAQVESYLRDRYKGSHDLEARVRVARAFLSDPIGVVTYFAGSGKTYSSAVGRYSE